MLRPIEPIESDLNSRFLRDRIKLADSGNVVDKHDYAVDAAREVSGLAPYLECWEQHRRRGRLPKVNSFDTVREKIGISGVHLVETPSAEFQDFRFISFDSTTCVGGQDFSGTYVAEYPDQSFREAARLDYTAAATSGEGRLTVFDVHKAERSGKYARLVLPLSDIKTGAVSRLLVVVQLLEHCPNVAEDIGLASQSGGVDANAGTIGTEGDRFRIPPASEAAGFDLPRGRRRSAEGDEIVMRYFQSGIHEQLEDHDLLEWLLRNFLGPGDSRELADILIDEFGSLPAVLAMGRERLGDFPGLTTPALMTKT